MGQAKAAELAGTIVGKSDRIIREWVSIFFSMVRSHKAAWADTNMLVFCG